MHGVFIFSVCVRACVSRCFYWMAYSISTGFQTHWNSSVLSVCEFHSQQQQFVTNNVIIKYILPTKVFVYLNHSTWNNYSPRKRAVLRRVVFHCANGLCWASEKQRKGERATTRGEQDNIFVWFALNVRLSTKYVSVWNVNIQKENNWLFSKIENCRLYEYRVRAMLVF